MPDHTLPAITKLVDDLVHCPHPPHNVIPSIQHTICCRNSPLLQSVWRGCRAWGWAGGVEWGWRLLAAYIQTMKELGLNGERGVQVVRLR